MYINKETGKPAHLTAQDDAGVCHYTVGDGKRTLKAPATEFFGAHREATREEIDAEAPEPVDLQQLAADVAAQGKRLTAVEKAQKPA
jgi:hypothetical protein